MTGALIRPFNRKLRTDRLGHDAIDRDHAEISDCWFQTVNCQPIQFPFLIRRMKKVMRRHFAHEAAIMASYGNMLCLCHQREHDGLLEICDSAAALDRSDWRKAQSLLRHEFPKRVREHIICMDQILVLFINTRTPADNGMMCRHSCS